MKKTVGVIYGGKSCEHEVSVRSAYSVLKAINYEKFNILPIYISINGDWLKGSKLYAPPENENDLRLLSSLSLDVFKLKQELDVVFPLTHGTNGEDGNLQGMLNMLNIPYVGSDVLSSAVCMDKGYTKKLLDTIKIKQSPYIVMTKNYYKHHPKEAIQTVVSELSFPVFVKPANMGSSVGITKAEKPENLVSSIQTALLYDNRIVIEEEVVGRELEIGVLGNKTILTSAVGEVRTNGNFYDFESKYNGHNEVETIIPADIPQSIVERMKCISSAAYNALGCEGLARIDFFWDEDQDILYLNEVNTLPGFTPTSMYPVLFEAVGIQYENLIEELLLLALDKKKTKTLSVFAPKLNFIE